MSRYCCVARYMISSCILGFPYYSVLWYVFAINSSNVDSDVCFFFTDQAYHSTLALISYSRCRGTKHLHCKKSGVSVGIMKNMTSPPLHKNCCGCPFVSLINQMTPTPPPKKRQDKTRETERKDE